MLIEHRGAVPETDPTAYIAPTAVICGAVRDTPATVRMSRQSAWFAAHLDDRVIDAADGQ